MVEPIKITPKKICPIMSTAFLVTTIMPGKIAAPDGTPTLMAGRIECAEKECGIWNGGDDICGLNLSFSMNEIRILLQPALANVLETIPKSRG